ncbi:MAG: hypothetical protein WAU90_11025 [Methyloceanibacter sp.]
MVEETVTAVELLERLRFFEAEEADRMYDARAGSDLAATPKSTRRLAEIKTIYRGQFPV